ncbi:hypothetical protein MP228_004189 [Amoeboaphelidium protococcarum]|nr:hypothetical protein MP228_004189 [Amoeboaphelidium protococcarum]
MLRCTQYLRPCVNQTKSCKIWYSKESKIDKEKVNHAVVSVFDLFSISIGPSSSHTSGPLRACSIFLEDVKRLGLLDKVARLKIDLYGSLALTGVGHKTDVALLCGMEGEQPDKIDPYKIPARVERIKREKLILLDGKRKIPFDMERDIVFRMTERLPQHSNGMRFSIFDKAGDMLATNEYFSIGGGFVVNESTKVAHGENAYFKDKTSEEVRHSLVEQDRIQAGDVIEGSHDLDADDYNRKLQDYIQTALPFTNAQDLLELCEDHNLSIAQVVFKNELRWKSAQEVRHGLLKIWKVMDECIDNGIKNPQNQKYLPGNLDVKRRAPSLHRNLMQKQQAIQQQLPESRDNTLAATVKDEKSLVRVDTNKHSEVLKQVPSSFSMTKSYKRSLPAVDWLSLYAIAVNEENAAGGRVVTSPTNGASGVLPSVLKYFLEFVSGAKDTEKENEVLEFLLTAGCIGMLYKRSASLSAAELGCQAEVGVACSMAAAALTAVLGGSVRQIENAAEIAMEHNLGLSCDPIGGYVIIPCIERNALGAVKAVASAQLALAGDGTHRVSLDQVIETMRQTGLDMKDKYKETSLGGLAVNVPLC